MCTMESWDPFLWFSVLSLYRLETWNAPSVWFNKSFRDPTESLSVASSAKEKIRKIYSLEVLMNFFVQMFGEPGKFPSLDDITS